MRDRALSITAIAAAALIGLAGAAAAGASPAHAQAIAQTSTVPAPNLTSTTTTDQYGAITVTVCSTARTGLRSCTATKYSYQQAQIGPSSGKWFAHITTTITSVDAIGNSRTLTTSALGTVPVSAMPTTPIVPTTLDKSAPAPQVSLSKPSQTSVVKRTGTGAKTVYHVKANKPVTWHYRIAGSGTMVWSLDVSRGINPNADTYTGIDGLMAFHQKVAQAHYTWTKPVRGRYLLCLTASNRPKHISAGDALVCQQIQVG